MKTHSKKKQLIKQLVKLLSSSTSSMLDFSINLTAVNPKTNEYIDFGLVTVREFLISIVDTEL